MVATIAASPILPPPFSLSGRPPSRPNYNLQFINDKSKGKKIVRTMNGGAREGGLVALTPVVQDFFENLGRGPRIGMALFFEALGKLVHDVHGLLVRDL